MNTLEKNKLLKVEKRKISDFTVNYFLYETERDGRLSYNIKLEKIENGEIITETAEGIDYHFKTEEATEIFEKIVKGEVTPVSLEDILYDLI